MSTISDNSEKNSKKSGKKHADCKLAKGRRDSERKERPNDKNDNDKNEKILEEGQVEGVEIHSPASSVSLSPEDPEMGLSKLDDIVKHLTSDLDRSQTASSSSSVADKRESDECDDLLSDYTSETTFFDAERSPSHTGER